MSDTGATDQVAQSALGYGVFGILADGATEQVANVSAGSAFYSMFHGPGATEQAAASSAGTAVFGVPTAGGTLQAANTSSGSGVSALASTGATTQRVQLTRGVSTGPARGAPRPSRPSRGDSDSRRVATLILRTGA